MCSKGHATPSDLARRVRAELQPYAGAWTWTLGPRAFELHCDACGKDYKFTVSVSAIREVVEAEADKRRALALKRSAFDAQLKAESDAVCRTLMELESRFDSAAVDSMLRVLLARDLARKEAGQE